MNKEYWENRYEQLRLGWDIGSISSPLKAYIDQLNSRELKILIPGAGYGYEAVYLYQQGFEQVFVMDIARQPLERVLKDCPEFPKNQLLEADFFKAEPGKYDLILEQTFFCALDPSLRHKYVLRMHGMLKEGGRLAGLFFDFPLTKNGPPFGGSREEYRDLFEPHFRIRTLERAYNSIAPRQGNELFFIFER